VRKPIADPVQKLSISAISSQYTLEAGNRKNH